MNPTYSSDTSISDGLPKDQTFFREGIPNNIKTGSRFVVWRREPRGEKIAKPPYQARPVLRTGKLFLASTKNRQKWATFKQCLDAIAKEISLDGIGVVLGDRLVMLDVDHCISWTSGRAVLEPAARRIIQHFQTAYIELSPSRTGIHIYFFADIADTTPHIFQYDGLKVELYWYDRYGTLTGKPVPGMEIATAVIEQQSEIASFLTLCEAIEKGEEKKQPKRKARTQPRQAILAEEQLSLADQDILRKARSAKNGAKFTEYWLGGDPDKKGDTSVVDYQFILLLLYWTGDSAHHDTSEQVERIFKASPRYRPEKHEARSTSGGHSNLQLSIYKARNTKYGIQQPAPSPQQQQQKKQPERKRTYETFDPLYIWQRKTFDQESRNAQLRTLAEEALHEIKDHTASNQDGTLYVTALPPGTGKSHALGGWASKDADIAVVLPRHELAESNPGYRDMRHIQAPNKHNCESWQLHQLIASLGYNTRPIHTAHAEPCEYIKQFEQEGSALYQIAHSETSYVGSHSAIVIDEWNLPDWLVCRDYSIDRLRRASHQFHTESAESLFLVAIQAVLSDLAEQDIEGSYQGRSILDLLQKHLAKTHLNGLANTIGILGNRFQAIQERPWATAVEESGEQEQPLPEVVLPHLFRAIAQELVRWQKNSDDYNSCIRVVVRRNHSGEAYAVLQLTKPRAIQTISKNGEMCAVAMADATAHAGILSAWRGGPVTVNRLNVNPPPHMKHIHLIERASKRAMQSKSGRDQERTIQKLRYFLKKFDPTGQKAQAGLIGLITYQGNEEHIRTALNIPSDKAGHFWAMRGSNALEQCEILLIVGTPTISPETMYRYARCVYRNDPAPIVEGSKRDQDTDRHIYLDERVQELSDYLTCSELTQCAHRHRPLRYDGKITISVCDAEIDYLPVTTEIVKMPALSAEGEELAEQRLAEYIARLDQARVQLEAQGIKISANKLATLAHVRKSVALEYARQCENTGCVCVGEVVTDSEPKQKREENTDAQKTKSGSRSAMNIYITAKREPFFVSLHTNETNTEPLVDVLEPHTQPQPVFSTVEESIPANEQDQEQELDTTCASSEPGSAPKYGKACARCGQVDAWTRNEDNTRWICNCYYWWYDHSKKPAEAEQQSLFATQDTKKEDMWEKLSVLGR